MTSVVQSDRKASSISWWDLYPRCLFWLSFGGLCLTPFLAFIFNSRMVYPSVTERNFMFRIGVELLTGVYFLLTLSVPRYRPHLSSIFLTMAAFAAWIGVAVVLSDDPVRSFWSTLERMGGYITLLHVFLFFVIASCVLNTVVLWERLFEVAVIVSAMMGVYVTVTGLNFYGRSAGTFGNSMYLGGYMLFNMFLSLFLIVLSAETLHSVSFRKLGLLVITLLVTLGIFVAPTQVFASLPREYSIVVILVLGFVGFLFALLRNRLYFVAFLVVALILQVSSLALTQARSAILGVLIGLVVASCYMWKTERSDKRRLELNTAKPWVLSTLAGFVLVLGIGLWLSDSSALRRIATISFADNTTTVRLLVWRIAWQGFLARPLTGWGPENFDLVFHRFYDPAMFAYETWFDNVHNFVLEWLIAGGLPAVFLFVALLAMIVRVFARSRRLTPGCRAVMVGLVTAYSFHGLFAFNDLHGSISFATIAAFAAALGNCEVRAESEIHILSHRTLILTIPTVAVLAIGGAYAINAPGRENAAGLLRAIMLGDFDDADSSKSFDANLWQFKKVITGAPLGRQEATEQLLEFTFLLGKLPDARVDQPTVQLFYEAAHSAMLRMLGQRREDARLEFLFGVFLNRFGQTEEAVWHLFRALQLAPNKQSILLELGINSYLRTQDKVSALPILRRAFALEPRNPDARISFAVALYMIGRTAEADQLIADGIDRAAPENRRATMLELGRALDALSTRLETRADDAQKRLAFARVRYRVEDRTGAIAELQHAAQDDPSVAEEAMRLMTQIQDAK